MPGLTEMPIGLALTRTARAVSRAFDDALAAAGSSLPVWLILMNLKRTAPSTQSALAAAVGIREATLSHHLNALEADGLVTRTRNPANRRIHDVELTKDGEARFLALVGVARAHDERLRAGLDDQALTALRATLETMRANV